MTEAREYHTDPTTIPEHWHYATASPGYSPNTDSSFPSVTDIFDLAAELAQELGEAEEFLQESMGICAEHDDAEGLLKEYKRLGVVEEAALQLCNIPRQRRMAFWAERPGQLEQRVLQYITDFFPLPISHNSHLEVWLCQAGQECEHWEADQ